MSPPASMPASPAVLVLIQDAGVRAALLDALAPVAETVCVRNTVEAAAMLRERAFGVLCVEDELPGETGIMFLARINSEHPWLRRILICGQLESDLLVFLINEANVFRCAAKPIDPATVRVMVTQALAEHHQAHQLAETVADHARLSDERTQPGQRTRWAAAIARFGIVSLPRIFTVSLLAAAWVFLIGVVLLLALYGFKTLLGIDLIAGFHLRDLFR